MSGLDSLCTTAPQPDYNNYNHRNSFSSGRSNSPLSPPNDGSWDVPDMYDSPKRSTKRGLSTFISKLYSMVSSTRNQQLISWNPSGTSFLVCNAVRFAQEVLPEHFKHSNFSSFVRQLNMYGFHKINKSPRGQRGSNENEIWEFSHQKFQRGFPNLLESIKRKAMDSELLRRETGDIHASFSMVQLSQTDLLQQFRVLQENFSNLLQGFEEMKKIQLQQQIIIRGLSQRQNVPLPSSQLQEMQYSSKQPSVFVTFPTASPYQSLQQWGSKEQTIQNNMMNPSMYNNNSQQNYSLNMSNQVPPSPASSILLSPPSSSSDSDSNNNRRHQRTMSAPSHNWGLNFPNQQ